MPIANYSTSVGVNQTVAAITKMLVSHGATNVTQDFGPTMTATGLTFGIQTEYGWMPFRLPVRIAAVHAALTADAVKPSQKTPEHAARVAWRIAHDWCRAQLALIDAGMASLPEVFFPYAVVGPNDETAFQHYVARRAVEA